MKYKLSIVRNKFIIDTTYMDLCASERQPLRISLNAKHRKKDSYYQVNIIFKIFAKVEFTHMNFWEKNYDDIDIQDCIDNYDVSGMFIVKNSKWESKRNIFDPRDRFNLMHFLIVGSDSYIEVLANENFEVIETPLKTEATTEEKGNNAG